MNVLLSHSGKQHSYYVARALKSLSSLYEFHTSSYVTSEFLQKIALKSGDSFLTKRFLLGLHGKEVVSHWLFELREQVFRRLYGIGTHTQNAVFERDERFDMYMSKYILNKDIDVFWGFQGSCLESLKVGGQLGIFTVCELSTGHVPSAMEILGDEAERLPEWSDSMDNYYFPDRYLERLEQEPINASRVIVASNFSKKTLINAGVEESKIDILPLGFDLEMIPFSSSSFTKKGTRPLRLLYTGRITQRKGISYLLEAISSFDPKEVTLDIIGFLHGSGHAFAKYRDRVRVLPNMSQSELFKKYGEYDALVLPTLFEGFGLVIIEAMAAGLPVITTPHSIGPEVILEDQNGYIVPIRDVDAIHGAIERLLEKNCEQLMDMRSCAREAALKYSWDVYTQRLDSLMRSWNLSRN